MVIQAKDLWLKCPEYTNRFLENVYGGRLLVGWVEWLHLSKTNYFWPPKNWCVFPSLESPFPDFSICFSGVFTMLVVGLECGCDSVCERFRPTRLHRWDGRVILLMYIFCLEGGLVMLSGIPIAWNQWIQKPAFSPEKFINHGGQSSPTTQKLKNNSFVFWNFLGPLANLFI